MSCCVQAYLVTKDSNYKYNQPNCCHHTRGVAVKGGGVLLYVVHTFLWKAGIDQ